MSKIILVCIVLMLAMYGCGEVIEKDISGETVYLRAPTDSLVTSERTFTYWWEYVDGASHYQLLIVSPNMDQTVHLLLDTTVEGDQVRFTLPNEGDYEWCVRGLNGYYQTELSCRKIKAN